MDHSTRSPEAGFLLLAGILYFAGKHYAMSACNFSLPFQGDPAALLQKARNAVTNQGGHFQGNEQAGNFNLTVFGNTIAGSYNIAGGNMDIIISDKPFLLPCGTIEGFLKSQLGI